MGYRANELFVYWTRSRVLHLGIHAKHQTFYHSNSHTRRQSWTSTHSVSRALIQPGIMAAVFATVITESRGNIENLSPNDIDRVFGALLMVSMPKDGAMWKN